MRKVLLEKSTTEPVVLSSLSEVVPIFAEKEGQIRGMVLRESKGWILRISATGGCSGHYETREMCVKEATTYGYTFVCPE